MTNFGGSYLGKTGDLAHLKVTCYIYKYVYIYSLLFLSYCGVMNRK